MGVFSLTEHHVLDFDIQRAPHREGIGKMV
jgi:hypothetical protein